MGVWIEDEIAYHDETRRTRDTLMAAGHRFLRWQDGWAKRNLPPNVDPSEPLFYHVSLSLAAELAARGERGVWCDVERLSCAAWYEDFAPWLLHERYLFTTVRELVADPRGVVAPLCERGEEHAWDGHYFVRPQSPLKPFSGRVLHVEETNLMALDHGFYYEDEALEVVVAPTRTLTQREWRCVIVRSELVAMSAYDASTRGEVMTDGEGAREVRDLVDEIAACRDLTRFGPGVVADFGEVEGGGWRLLEFNPLSGASLYGCDALDVAEAIFHGMTSG